jgi:hypothetical protein
MKDGKPLEEKWVTSRRKERKVMEERWQRQEGAEGKMIKLWRAVGDTIEEKTMIDVLNGDVRHGGKMVTTGRTDDQVMEDCWWHDEGKNSDDVIMESWRHGGKMVKRKYHPLGNLGVHILTPWSHS